jgi:hypothetical protein
VEIEVASPPIEFDVEVGTAGVDVETGTPGETVALVIVSGSPGASGAGLTGDTLTGAKDGVNTTFTTTFSFLPGSTAVYLNGLRESGYAESGSSTIVFEDPPQSGDTLVVDYFI